MVLPSYFWVGVGSFYATYTWLLVLETWKERKTQKLQTLRVKQLFHENKSDMLTYSGTHIAKMIREGAITSEEVVNIFIKQIELLEPYLNALCGTRFERAREEAKEKDRVLKEMREKKQSLENLPPFFGVPIITKEVYELEAMPYCAGSVGLKNNFGKADCFAMKKLKKNAGVVILATGNISEMCMWMESSNLVYGRSNNFHDLSNSVGGSSGGNGLAIAACYSPISITSDVGGSTRIPALFNGLFGLKPTGGSVSNQGTIPQCFGRVNYYCQLGPTARHAEDLLPLFKSIMGLDVGEIEEGVGAFATKSFKELDKKRSRISSLDQVNVYSCMRQASSKHPLLQMFRVDREEAMRVAHADLAAKIKSNVEEVDFKLLDEAFDIWGAMLGGENLKHNRPFRYVLANAHGDLYNGSRLWAFVELFKYLLSFGWWSDFTLPGLGLSVIEQFEEVTPWKTRSLMKKGEQLKADIKQVLERKQNSIIIFPSLPKSTVPHGPLPNLLDAASCAATAIFNVLEFPALHLPLGFNEDGLPIGVQIVANHGDDELLMEVAHELNKKGFAKSTPVAQ